MRYFQWLFCLFGWHSKFSRLIEEEVHDDYIYQRRECFCCWGDFVCRMKRNRDYRTFR